MTPATPSIAFGTSMPCQWTVVDSVSSRLTSRTSTSSPSRTRISVPGTVPPNVQASTTAPDLRATLASSATRVKRLTAPTKGPAVRSETSRFVAPAVIRCPVCPAWPATTSAAGTAEPDVPASPHPAAANTRTSGATSRLRVGQRSVAGRPAARRPRCPESIATTTATSASASTPVTRTDGCAATVTTAAAPAASGNNRAGATTRIAASALRPAGSIVLRPTARVTSSSAGMVKRTAPTTGPAISSAAIHERVLDAGCRPTAIAAVIQAASTIPPAT